MELETSDQLGKVLKSRGKSGEIIINSDLELPENLTKVESIFLEIEGGLVPFFIEHILLKSTHAAILKLEDINTVEQANELAYCNWFLEAEDWEQLTQETPQPFETIEGFMLIDQYDQQTGIIEGIQKIPHNTLLQIRYQGNLIDVPINEETIYYIDQEKQIVKNHLPEGLLEI